MKKMLFLILILSVVSFSKGDFEASEDILEKQFEIEYSVISDGKTQIKDIEYDLTISQNRAILELEIESTFGDANWSKLDKQIFEKVIFKLVKSIRSEVNNPKLDVTVFVKLDKKIGSDKTLFNKTY
ncbi:hypothetical protein [Psychrilyobacter atlanticus]|uniref:hypothetical protein n=1 Tax=Psychrilyobacter atlanticus TaxID=271091 RepID=UPI0003FC5F63|nr:hypothetical protein [Psychrilyobacter atlanticus]